MFPNSQTKIMQFKILHKLLFASLFSNMLVAGCIYLATIYSFDKSFAEYLNDAQAERLAPMVSELAKIYQEKESWDWIHSHQNHLWSQLIQKYVIPQTRQRSFKAFPPPPPHHHPPPNRPPFHQPPNRPYIGPPSIPPNFDGKQSFPRKTMAGPHSGPSDTLDIAPTVLLADSEHNTIIGNPLVEAHWIPIINSGTTVGFLGFYREINLTSEIDRIFINKLRTILSWVTFAAILFSILISLVLAKIIVNPIKLLNVASNKLAQGNFSSKTIIHSNDEIGELSKDFNQLADTLEHNLKARQQWIADISHELRTPIAVLQGELEALQDGVRPISNDAIDSLHHEIIRLSRLINDLHQLSLSDLGSLSYKYEKINIVDVIEDVIEHKVSIIEQKQIDIRFKYQKKNIMVNGDYHRLIQLFYNILNNSLTYTKDAGIISIKLSIVADEIIIKWCDSEPGVSDNDIENLFDRLYRAEGSRSRNTGGSGLGLSICKNITDAHQGEISASHAELGGVCFTIQLPVIR